MALNGSLFYSLFRRSKSPFHFKVSRARCLSLGSLTSADAVDPESQIAEQRLRNEDAGQFTELVRDFLNPKDFYNALCMHGMDFFCGVPDSLLKDFCAYVTAVVPKSRHVITSNEGQAIALAAGYHMATGRAGVVYLQNSGLGNIVNPVMSLAVPNVYSIPMLLLVGWRGEPGKRDEPQHVVQGQATPGILASCGIPFQVLPDYQEGAEQALYVARKHMETTKGPYCLLVRRQNFLPFKLEKEPDIYPLNREGAMKTIVDALGDRDVVVGTTGMLSRELFEYRVAKGQGHEKDFLTVGSMGHASAIALGIAQFRPKRQVFCFDGDGAVLMHMGALATIGQSDVPNFKHIVINNGCHDSVGGQPTSGASESFDFLGVARSCGYKAVMRAEQREEVLEAVKFLRGVEGPVLLEIRTNKGGRKDLGRPTRTPIQNKKDFMHFLAIDH
ncbi:phosphonopyruvate decarboxylase-like isoform X1 [Montipora foliosa]|uniref:phosphonopyruvate decarboxylase-like isoform X1 n=2 Tax=Montipora foliosa TaxID=591990 RepID=UPI0035F15C9A